MANSHLQLLLSGTGATSGEDGWLSMPDGRSLSLQLAHEGVPLTIARIRSLRERDAMVEARTIQGELHLFLAADVFALVIESPKETTRKAGFV
jgi:hypothetical protein